MNQTSGIARRTLVGALVLGGGAALVGGDRLIAAAGKRAVPMIVYKDPQCGCCDAWAQIARANGYAVTIRNSADMAAVKARYGVPGQLASCHTAVVGGYAIEGHVPLRHVARLLATRPRNIRGIAVPGMPRGSPGMEMPDGTKDAFDVLAFDTAGRITQFRA